MAPNQSLASFQLFFPSPATPMNGVQHPTQIKRDELTKMITRAKKFVWQSSKLAPLVCKFGWAICVYGGKSGREVYTHSHALHTEHTHTTTCMWLILNYAKLHLYSIERIVSLVDEHHGYESFLHVETHHT